ncbi:hypothetical protein N7448_010292 [Penicillium atrosanguineum]|uniref:Uncharacterized protein n=1 Tax=Penicillium atrosanguineum TaxID=1132637 RepID=A0A9W9GFU5_9EURO|nr:uncharacterized protein N7443_007517 [Penicillium atrosanguineum]KAJ5118584.1 hypothetical protein N7526_010221 [Penicillium atrosanguineum]KAJ5119623.1 hypothetical protein N7448_010292 [Penicillium atrosanguineum]KAJ5296624.1 hypothetical protein N7443_007517 [Penicillium atrosanguineum]KAJ5299387.1 hypothetical protein N7476_010944 [Penicillium atrosanguineum]
MTTPTLINLPPPPSDPVTPSDMGPGTPNSGTTSLSALSTTAIKDGHQGQPFPHGRHAHQSSSASASSTTTLEAERADRISRLAGLERVATARQGPTTAPSVPHGPGYFDGHALKERSTVGSASATGSFGGHTTWTSSDTYEADKMSEGPDADDGQSSVGNMSDEGNASLVGFGEGANSTISGPVSRPPGVSRISSGGLARPTSMSSNVGRLNPLASYIQQQGQQGDSMMAASPTGSTTPEPVTEDARMVDGMTFDSDVVDTTARTPRLATPNQSSGGFDFPSRE